MATRLIGTDTANPRLPTDVINATRGTTAADLAPGNVAVGKANTTTTISTTAPLAGGGDLSVSRSLTIAEFTPTTPGVVPPSGGGTTNYLRADGGWATPGVSGGGGGGVPGHTSYSFNATTTAPPLATQLRMNNVNQLAVTTLWVHQNDYDSLDVTIALARILAGTQIYLQDYDDASFWIKYNVTSAVDSGSYFTYTVTYHSGPGGLTSGSGGASRIELQPVAPGTIGLPPGGTTGQVIVKDTATDYDVSWGPPTVADDAVTNAKLANMAPNTIKGRTSGTGDPADLTPANARSIIASDSGGTPTTVFLRGDGNWAAPPGGGGGTARLTQMYTVPGPLAPGTGITEFVVTVPGDIVNCWCSTSATFTGSAVIVDVNINGVTVFTTQANRPTVVAGARRDISATPDAAAADFIAGDRITVDVDQVGTHAAGDSLTIGVEYIYD
jgi:hypothetical protein